MSEPRVVRAEFDGALCRTFSQAGAPVAAFRTAHKPVYNGQYRVPLSQDGTRLYVPTWERGLFCYNTTTGELIWKQGPGKVRQVEVVGESLAIEMAGRGIYVRDARTGRLVREEKFAGIDAFFRIGADRLFAGPKRNRYFVFHLPDLQISHEIPAAFLNRNHCLSFKVLGVHGANPMIVLSGWEQYPEGDGTSLEPQEFKRGIFLDDFAMGAHA